MIPRTIHYCWFGKAELPESFRKYMDSWNKYCPNYEIKRWNESNYNYRARKYTAEAYNAEKWAFVSDVARLEIIYNYGGFYFDTDVELIRALDDLRNNVCFMGLEQNGCVATGLGFGAEKGNNFLAENLALYDRISFYNQDGTYNLTPCVQFTTQCLKKKYGPIVRNKIQTLGSVTIYPSSYFCPNLRTDGKADLLPETYSIHWYAATWNTEKERNISNNSRWIYTHFGSWGKRLYDGYRLLKNKGFRLFVTRIIEIVQRQFL